MAQPAMDFLSTAHTSGVSLQKQNTELMENNTKLQAHNSKLKEHNTKLLAHNDSLNETVKSLSESCQASEEKIKLQAQLHADQVRTYHSKDKTLSERCQTLAAFAEQHRLGSLKHEVKHTNLAKDLQSMAAVQVATEKMHAAEMKTLQSSLKAKDLDVQSLQASMHALKRDQSKQTTELGQKLEAVSGRLQKVVTLLRESPEGKLTDTLNSLKCSAEVMQLAHQRGGVDSMRECLGQVSAVLEDLHGELETHHRLASDWQERVRNLVV